MKKKVLVFALALMGAGAFPCSAANNGGKDMGLSFEVGADLVSSYIWRGQNLGGLSIQPSITFGWQGLYLSGWWNVGADNWTFQELNPEMDWTFGFDRWGVQVDLTHYYYFYGEKFLTRNCDMTLEDNTSRSTMELHAGFHLGDLVENAPFYFDWYTTVLGGDGFRDEQENLKRAFSTYVEIGYDFNLPFGSVIGARIGITPWRGAYTGYEEVWKDKNTVGFNNLSLRFEHEFELPSISLSVFAEGMLNCYGINKTNAICKINDRSEQRLNGCIGASLYFGNDW